MGVFEESKGRLKQAIGYIPPDPSPSGAVEIFISYAREDVGMQERLLTHLSRLRRQGVATTWTDREIAPGEKWRSSINARLEAADIILLLVSADFINSDYCWDVEVKRALRRQAEGTARVIPVILRECDWKSLPFGELQAVPQSLSALGPTKTPHLPKWRGPSEQLSMKCKQATGANGRPKRPGFARHTYRSCRSPYVQRRQHIGNRASRTSSWPSR